MLIITQDTEAAFKNELDFCTQKNQTWRCIVFKFSQARQMPENWFSETVEKIAYCLGENSGKIFLYSDGDLHILSRHVTQKSFLFLLTHLQPTLTPVPLKGLASLYELPVDLEILKNMRVKPERENKIEIEFRKPSLYVDSLHQSLVTSISDRRAKHEKAAVLIVEDDPFSQRLVGKSLEDNYGIFTASSGQDALNNYIRNAPDVVFLDIGLPDASGLDVLLKIFEVDPKAYVVMLSGNGSRSNVVTAIQNGAKGFVAKPFSRDKLIHYIDKCPSTQNARQTGSVETRI